MTTADVSSVPGVLGRRFVGPASLENSNQPPAAPPCAPGKQETDSEEVEPWQITGVRSRWEGQPSMSFVDALESKKPHPDLGRHAETYGRLIGSWTGTLHNHMAPGGIVSETIEIHFAWVLEGRAIQDMWITPARSGRTGSSGQRSLNWYGTTFRTFDAKTESWRSRWLDPVSGFYVELEGRRQGDDIVQLGNRGGRLIRWSFSDIHRDSFVWRGHVLESDGESWRLEVEIHARRVEKDSS